MFFLSWYVSTHRHHQTTHISQLKTLGKGQEKLVEMRLERRVFTNLWYYMAKQDLSLGFSRVGTDGIAGLLVTSLYFSQSQEYCKEWGCHEWVVQEELLTSNTYLYMWKI